MEINIETKTLNKIADLVQDENPAFAARLREAWEQAQMPLFKTQVQWMPIEIGDNDRLSYKSATKQMRGW